MLSSLGPSQVGAQIGSFHQIANTKKKCLKSHHLDSKKKTGETLTETTKWWLQVTQTSRCKNESSKKVDFCLCTLAFKTLKRLGKTWRFLFDFAPKSNAFLHYFWKHFEIKEKIKAIIFVRGVVHSSTDTSKEPIKQCGDVDQNCEFWRRWLDAPIPKHGNCRLKHDVHMIVQGLVCRSAKNNYKPQKDMVFSQ